LLWDEQGQLLIQRAFLPPDPELLRAINARLLEIEKIVADALRIADLTAEVDPRIVEA
jgi:hypothetical protein